MSPQERPPLLQRFQTGLVLGALSVAVALPGTSQADCVQTDTAVTCSGLDPNGFDAGLDDELTVEVEAGATVQSPATGDAIRLNATSTVNVRDTATVSATGASARAIAAGDDATIQIDPGAQIEADGAGVIAIDAGDSANLVNEGTVHTSGDGATALRAGANAQQLVNSGTIEMHGADITGLAAGDGAAAVVNLSDLSLFGDNAVGLQIGSDTQSLSGNSINLMIEGHQAVGISAQDDNDNLINNGLIRIDGDEGIGIRLGSGNSLINRPVDTGEGQVGTIEVTGPGGVGVLLGDGGGTDNFLQNFGPITGGSNSGTTIGAAVSTLPAAASSTNTIRNETGGTLAAGGSGIAVLGGDGIDILRNAGAITGHVQLGAGDDVYRLLPGGRVEGTVDGQSGSDLVALAGEGAGVFDATDLTGFEQLELSSAEWTLRGDGAFSGGTTIDGADGGVLVLDEFATLTSDVTLSDDAVVRAVVDPQGTHGSLAVSGAITVGNNARFEVVALDGFLAGQTLTLLSASGGIGPGSDPFAAVLPSDTAFLDFELVQEATSVDLVIARLRTYASLAANASQGAVAANLDSISNASPTGEMAELLGDIDGLATSQVSAAYQSLQPEAYDAHSSTLISLGSAIVDEVASARLRCDRTYRYQLYSRNEQQPNPCGSKGRTFWVDGLVSYTQRDPRTAHVAFDSTGGALLAGADLEAAGWQISAFAGSSYASIEVTDVGEGAVSSVELGALAQRRFWGLRFQTVALYGHGWHKQQRAIEIAASPIPDAHARFESDRFISRSELAYRLEWGALELHPLAQLEYTFVGEDPFEEKRSGGARLAVDERRASQLRSAFGARLSFEGFQDYWLSKWLTWIDGTWRADLEGRWLRVWSGDERVIQAGFIEAPGGIPDFRVRGRDFREAALFGTRVQFQPLDTAAVIGIGYDFQFGDDTIAHRGSLRVQVPF